MDPKSDQLDGMVCDIETGICGPADEVQVASDLDEVPLKLTQFRPSVKKVDLYYVTDPVCSHCWALEPVLRRFEHEYGRHLNTRVVMGGLLPEWDGFADRANGIQRPADVAHHWREVGEAARMPIDGSVWLRDPLSSSFPPSRVYVVLRERDPELARTFLRRSREALFAFDRNIAAPAVLMELVDALAVPGLSGHAVLAEAQSERGHELLRRDIALARELGVRGFPTVLLIDENGAGVKVTGARPLESYVDALGQVMGDGAALHVSELPPLDDLLEREGRLFAKEIETYYDVAPGDVAAFVQTHVATERSAPGSVLGESYWERSQLGSASLAGA